MINPAKFALFAAPVINVFMIVFKPFVWLLSISTEGVIRLLRLNTNKDKDKITETEIKEMIVYGHIEGLYNSEEKDMMNRIFRLDDLNAEMIMTPKNLIVGLDLADPNLDDIINSRYSRIPVFDGGLDNIKGVIYVKDLLIELKDKMISDVDISALVRDPYIISENIKTNTLLKQMRDSFEHLAFIVNDSNKLVGIITLEDIVEEIVGNIYDEHDFIGEFSETNNEFGYILDADMLVRDIEGKLGITIDSSSKNFETLREFVLSKLEEEPKADETPIINIDSGHIKVLSVRDGNIDQIELVLDEEKLT